MSHQRNVYLIDDEPADRQMIGTQLTTFGVEAWPFSSATDFIDLVDHLPPACILLDLNMPDISGLDVLAELVRKRIDWPVIALSDWDGIQPAVAAMKLGAIDFLMKPVDRYLLEAALSFGRSLLSRASEVARARHAAEQKTAKLTRRERDIALALLDGRSNKSTAYELGISIRTVEMHRAHIMAKLEARSPAEAAIVLVQAGLMTVPGDRHTAQREEALRSCFFGSAAGSAIPPDRRLPAPVNAPQVAATG
jgi:two-component system, LuxR family, response regulator FixJ